MSAFRNIKIEMNQNGLELMKMTKVRILYTF